jgi:hypothetical protein
VFDSTVSIQSTCTINSNNEGECNCVDEDSGYPRTDCTVWMNVCSFAARSCDSAGTLYCDLDSNNAQSCVCKQGYYGALCDTTQVTDCVGVACPVKPQECPTWPAGATVEKTITLQYVTDISDMLRDDIVNQGWCYKVIESRIYGSMQMTAELMSMAPAWIQHFEDVESDLTTRTKYANDIRDAFFNSFTVGNTASSILNNFCEELTALLGGNTNLKTQLYDRCLNDRWRFQGIINNGNLDHCEHTIVPASSGSNTCSGQAP